MPVRLLNKIAPSLCLMKVTFGFDTPNATIGAGVFSPQPSRQEQRFETCFPMDFSIPFFARSEFHR